MLDEIKDSPPQTGASPGDGGEKEGKREQEAGRAHTGLTRGETNEERD